MTRSRRLATRVCMLVKAYQRRSVSRLYQPSGVLHLEPAVDGDRVVDGAEDRDAELRSMSEQAVAEALVVVDEVEVAPALAEVVPGPQREGQRLGEGAGREGGDLDEVRPVLQLPDARASASGSGRCRCRGWAARPAAPARRAPGRAGRRAPRRGGPGRPAPWSGGGCTRPGRRRGACPGRRGGRCGAGRRWGMVRQAFRSVDHPVKPTSRPGEVELGWRFASRRARDRRRGPSRPG